MSRLSVFHLYGCTLCLLQPSPDLQKRKTKERKMHKHPNLPRDICLFTLAKPNSVNNAEFENALLGFSSSCNSLLVLAESTLLKVKNSVINV